MAVKGATETYLSDPEQQQKDWPTKTAAALVIRLGDIEGLANAFMHT